MKNNTDRQVTAKNSGSIALPLLFILLIAGCAGFGGGKPAVVPMPVYSYEYEKGAIQDTVVVFLPGLGDAPQDFIDNGFAAELWKERKADILIADAHIGYYENGTILERLEKDVFARVRSGRYKQVVLVGISMGGGGSLLSAKTWPELFDAVVLIAPFLGDGDLIAEIAAQGAKNWTSRSLTGRSERDAQFRSGWQWAQQKALSAKGEQLPKLYLAAGENDRLRAFHNLFAPLVPPENLFRTPGGHDWKTWKTLWAMLIQQAVPEPGVR